MVPVWVYIQSEVSLNFAGLSQARGLGETSQGPHGAQQGNQNLSLEKKNKLSCCFAWGGGESGPADTCRKEAVYLGQDSKKRVPKGI